MSNITVDPPMEPPGAAPTPPTDEQVIKTWLDTKYLDYPYHGKTLSIYIKDLLRYTSTRSTDPDNAWLSEDQIVLPVALTVDNKVRRDILVIESHAAAHLASVGLGLVTPDDFAAIHPGIVSGMKDENVRWIIVPCNDGMIHQAGILLDARKSAEPPVTADGIAATTQTETEPNTMKKLKSYYGTGSSQGIHWGVMIIDKTKNEARWLDGALNLQRRNGKVYVGPMFPAARAAGKALCGYDRVMELPRGKFAATTLKHVPNDHGDNSFKGDAHCACGPWVIAIIQYILDNESFLTDPNGLKGTFASNRRAQHVRSMAFDSLRTRKAANQMVQGEYDNQNPNSWPYRLTPRIAKILDVFNPDGLPMQVRNLLNKRRAPPSGMGGKDDGDNGDDDQHSSGDDDDDESGKFENTDVLKSTLMGIVNQDPSAYSHLGTKTEKMRQALENQRELARSMATAKEAAREEAERAKANANAYVSGPHSGKNWKRQYPEGFNENNLPDFANLTASDDVWYNIYLSDLFNVSTRTTGRTYLTRRAVMHKTYKGSFSNEPSKSLEKHLDDRFAFHEAELRKKWTAKDIADRLNYVYNDLAIPSFAALTPDDINHWVDGMPPAVAKILVKADKSIDCGRARGILHRMFVGEFDEMLAEQIANWRVSDPSISFARNLDNETAMVAMKILYDGPDVRHLPWLKDSPLHWPLREYRSRTSRKRSREEEDTEEGEIGEKDDIGDDEEAMAPPTRSPPLAKKPKITAASEGPAASTPAAAPPPVEDPRPVNWITITDVELARYEYITPAIRNDRRVGPTANNYTYRAILFLQHGGTFKVDSPDQPMELWIRDTNVFKHGLDPNDTTIDLTLDRENKNQLSSVLERAEILRRMATHYESADRPAKPKAPGGKVNIKDLHTHPINFARMTIAEINSWVAKKPVGNLLTAEQKHPQQRAILQHIFGGIDNLTDDDIKQWRQRDTQFKKGKWNKTTMKKALKERAKGVPTLDLRGRLLYYPDEWIEKNM